MLSISLPDYCNLLLDWMIGLLDQVIYSAIFHAANSPSDFETSKNKILKNDYDLDSPKQLDALLLITTSQQSIVSNPF
mgnify:FL=1